MCEMTPLDNAMYINRRSIWVAKLILTNSINYWQNSDYVLTFHCLVVKTKNSIWHVQGYL